MKRHWLLVVAAIVVLVVAAGLAGGDSGPERGSGALGASPTPPTQGTIVPSQRPGGPTSTSLPPMTSEAPLPSTGTLESLGTLLSMLRIAPEERTGYSRTLFVHWIDANGDGCDTRREVLIQEAVVKPGVGPHCSLTGGKWVSFYDGLSFSDPSKLQIDHVVALAEAWASGAAAWSPARRMAFANDLDAWFALTAVSASSNESKSDRDPADWLPPSRAAECPFIGAWIATKVRWDLAVDQREHDALSSDIADCPTTTMPYLPAGTAGETGGFPEASAGSDGSGATGGGCDPAYPTVCIAPPPPDLDCADVPYRDFTVLAPDPHHFDGDRDGVGCET